MFLLDARVLAAAFGSVIATYPGAPNDMILNPVHPYLYYTVGAVGSSSNAVCVVNTQSLVQVASISFGQTPRGLAVSQDGSRLYVADYGGRQIGIIDAQN